MPVPPPDVALPSPRHAPVRGFSHRILGRFHVTGVFWYRLHYLGARILSPLGMRVVILVFTSFFFVVLSRIRRAVADNLTPVLGPATVWERGRRAFRTMLAFAECQTDRYRRAARPDEVRFTLDGEEHWHAATSGGRGAVMVTAHIGAWDLGAQLGAAEGRRRVHMVREEEMDPRAQAFVREIAGRGGDDFITHFATDDMRLGLQLRDALAAGDIVALQGDRPRRGGRTVPVTLFGRPMDLPAGPAALARTAGVPLVPVFNFRDGLLRTRTVVRPPITVSTSGARDADVADATRRLALDIEWAIRERPYQWFCFRSLWPS